MFGLVGAISSLIGNVSGGVMVDWVSRRDERWYVWLPALGILIAAPLYLGAFTIVDPAIAAVMLVVAGHLHVLCTTRPLKRYCRTWSSRECAPRRHSFSFSSSVCWATA